jgi:hypothetical protein
MKTLVRQLRRWQFREWLYRAAWGFARLSAVVAAGLFVCCLADWVIDRYRDTPFWLRLLMTGGQLVAYGLVAVFLLYRLHVPRIDVLAGKAEAEVPEFDHRLVTALQLNRRGAKTEGMSKELIAAVTREAETMSARHDLVRLADGSRLQNAAAVLVPVLLLAGGFVLVWPTLTAALLARQALLNVDIPRSVRIENATPPLWPSGDEVTLRFTVAGRFDERAEGRVRVEPEGQPADTYPLTFESKTDDGTATYAAKLPPSSVPFTFRARLQDGRTRGGPGEVRFEPRPVVQDIAALIILPEYVGRNPEGKRYGRFQPHGEVTAVAGCAIRVAATVQKPIAEANLVLLGRGDRADVLARVPMAIAEDATSAEATFDPPPTARGYRIEVKDRNGFANLNPPRRGIAFAPDDPPRVNLLAEVLKDPAEPGPLDDYEVTGMPLVLGGQVQVGYAARSPLGLSKAYVMYRVNEGDWTPLPLALTTADPAKVGRFLPELGVFERSGPFGQVEFYPVPAADPNEPPGLEAGGRYNFQTAALTKRGPDGKDTKLEVGDRVEFYVEAFDRNPAPGRPGGKSESRLKTVVTQSQLEDWMRQRDQSRDRLRQIEERQRGVFKPSAP